MWGTWWLCFSSCIKDTSTSQSLFNPNPCHCNLWENQTGYKVVIGFASLILPLELVWVIQKLNIFFLILICLHSESSSGGQFLERMCYYMPPKHRAFIEAVAKGPSIRNYGLCIFYKLMMTKQDRGRSKKGVKGVYNPPPLRWPAAF